MPIYEYECQACGYHHEALQKISDEPLTICPSCDAKALRKLVSAAGFRLSGSGWYETDFKSSNKKNLTQKDSDKKSSPKSNNTNTKSDTKKSASSATSK
ncbi:MAG: zinc ribbon domain-containing protein [Pseudomonadota bacterium]